MPTKNIVHLAENANIEDERLRKFEIFLKIRKSRKNAHQHAI